MARTQKATANKGSLRLVIRAEVGAAYVPFLRRHLRKAHGELRPRLEELSVALVGDRRMSDLHQRFMSIAGPTDVLTFPLDQDEHGEAVSGEIVICVPEARRRARSQGTKIHNELLLYGIHGLLHLAGFDDKTARGFKLMHGTEDQILTRLGIGPVFHGRSTPPAAPPAPPVPPPLRSRKAT